MNNIYATKSTIISKIYQPTTQNILKETLQHFNEVQKWSESKFPSTDFISTQENPTFRHCDADMASSKYVLGCKSWMHEAHKL